MSSRNRIGHRYRGNGRLRRRRLVAEPLEDRRLLAVSFEFNYIGGDEVGFNDAIEGPTYRAALESAAARLGGWLLHDATVQMDVISYPFDGTAIAKATSEPVAALASGGFVHRVIPAKILGQGDLNDTTRDGHVEVFFFGEADTFVYATDPAEVDADDEIDFQAAMIHELVHTLGFTSATRADGSDDEFNGITTPGTWTRFDQFVSDVDGNRLIDADPASATAFRMDTAAWATHSVGGKGPDAGLFFDGPIAKAVYGGRVPLYSPETFSLVSSLSHLDSEGYPNDSFSFSPLTHLMSHAIVDFAVPQELTVLEKAMLADTGIMLREGVPPTVIPPADIVVEGNAGGGLIANDQALSDFLAGATATDLIDPNPTLIHNAPSFLPLGPNTITFTATDASGNETSENATVSVVDTTPPNLTLPAQITIDSNLPTGADLANTQLIDLIHAGATDLVDQELSVSADIQSFPFGTSSVAFTVTDDSGNAVSATTALTVNDVTQNTPVLNWDNPEDISFGTRLSSEQLNATASAEGTFSYIPPAGVLMSAGQNQTLTVTFNPTSPEFDPVTTTVKINVNKADPLITWSDPVDIVAGTPLSDTQLSAGSNIPGTFSYDPSAGTVLDVGTDQTLTVTFTPDAAGNYNVVSENVLINVISPQDFGDAPESYPVLLAQDGARHAHSNLMLGSELDLDLDGQSSAAADGDGEDEDGVRLIADLVAVPGSETGASFTVEASAAGKLDAWIDFNRDGDWNDPADQVFTSVDVAAGENTLGYTIPAGAVPGITAARFRLSGIGGLAPTGPAADGEVEDYVVTIMDGGQAPEASVAVVGGSIGLSVEANQIVARSGQTELFRSPLEGLASLRVLGSSIDDSVTLDLSSGFAVPPSGLHLMGDSGGNTLVILGDGGAIDLTHGASSVSEFRRLDLSSDDVNSVAVDAAAVARLSPVLKLLTITAGEMDTILVKDPEGWRMSEPTISNGRFLVTANTSVVRGEESIEADVPHAWQNFLRAGDVNNDGSVTAADALRIINELSRREFSDNETQDLIAPLEVAIWPGTYFDHNGDDRVSALDSLRVINDLARKSLAGDEGEASEAGVMAAIGSVPTRPLPSDSLQLGPWLEIESTPRAQPTDVLGAIPGADAASADDPATPTQPNIDRASNPERTTADVDQLLTDEAFLHGLVS